MDFKKHVTSWKLWLVVSIILAIMVFQKNGAVSALLPYAAILICPIMMMFMMGGHHGKHDDHNDKKNTK